MTGVGEGAAVAGGVGGGAGAAGTAGVGAGLGTGAVGTAGATAGTTGLTGTLSSIGSALSNLGTSAMNALGFGGQSATTGLGTVLAPAAEAVPGGIGAGTVLAAPGALGEFSLGIPGAVGTGIPTAIPGSGGFFSGLAGSGLLGQTAAELVKSGPEMSWPLAKAAISDTAATGAVYKTLRDSLKQQQPPGVASKPAPGVLEAPKFGFGR